jgi:hypothetical protein
MLIVLFFVLCLENYLINLQKIGKESTYRSVTIRVLLIVYSGWKHRGIPRAGEAHHHCFHCPKLGGAPGNRQPIQVIFIALDVLLML